MEENRLIEKFNKNDRISKLISNAVGLFPGVGTFLSDLVYEWIPNYRDEYLVAFFRIFVSKLSIMEMTQINQYVNRKEFANLFEESVRIAINSVSEEKKEYVANIMLYGIDSNQFDYEKQRYFLQLINELNDTEIILLIGSYYSQHWARVKPEFFEKHKEIFDSEKIRFNSPEEHKQKAYLLREFRSHLERLGLLRGTYSMPNYAPDNKHPAEYDSDTGKLKRNGFRITDLGKELMRYLGISNN